MKYLLVTWDGGGNLAPELGVARSLIARGHSVVVLSDPTAEPEARAAGCDFTPWTTAPYRKTRNKEDDVLRDYETTTPFQMMDAFMRNFLATPAPYWIADTLAAIDAHGVDALLADFFLPATLIAAEGRKIPSAGLVPNIWVSPTPGIPPMGPGFMPARGPLGWMRDGIFRAAAKWLFQKALPALNAERKKLGLAPVASTVEQMVRADRMLVLTSPVFDFTSDAMPKHVRYVGPQLDDPAWTEEWTSPWAADDQRPLVLISLSSTYQNQAATLRSIVQAVSTMPVRALVTSGLCIAPSEIPGADNVVIVRSAPHHAILPHVAAVVTHCGHGTTLKALSHGAPVLCIPMGRDQNDTAARVVHRGAGLRLKPTDSPEKIRKALAKMLATPSYRERARALAKSIAEREQCVDVVDELEAIVFESRAVKPSADPAATRAAGSVASAHS